MSTAVHTRRNRVIRNALHLGMGQVATTALTILLSAAIARTLGASDFGLLYIITAICSFAYVFIDWGHAGYITREVARHPERTGELLGTVQAMRVVAAFAVCLPVVVITWLLGYDSRVILYAVVNILTWLPSYFVSAYSWVFRGHERMDYDAQLGIVLRLFSLIFTLICLAVGGRVLGLILISSASGCVALILARTMYRRLGLPRQRVVWATARELIQGGAPMLAHAVAVAVQPYLNANLLYKLAPAAVVGWYGVSWTIAGTLVAPSVILASAVYPLFSRAAGDHQHLQRVVRTTLRPLLLVATLGAVGTYLFADVAVALIYSEERFGQAADNLRVFAPTLVLIYADMLFGSVLFAVGKAGRLAGVKFAAVVLTTGVGWVLIPIFQSRYGNGGMGVLIAMGAGELLMVVASSIMVRETLNRRMLLDVARALLAAAATVVAIQSQPLVTPFVTIPLCILIFLALSFAVGLLDRMDIAALLEGLRGRPGDSQQR
jgi:O-antigen/teichoic acid export membrane protein